MASEPNQTAAFGIHRAVAGYIWLIMTIPILLCGVLAIFRSAPFNFGALKWLGWFIAFFGIVVLWKSIVQTAKLNSQASMGRAPSIDYRILKALALASSRSCGGLILVFVGTLDSLNLLLFWTSLAVLLYSQLKIFRTLWTSKLPAQ